MYVWNVLKRERARIFGPGGWAAKAAFALVMLGVAYGLAAAGAARADAAPASPPVYCAADGERCVVSEPSIVIYGAGTSATGRFADNGEIYCSAQTFGVDPAPGKAKACNIVSFGQLTACSDSMIQACPPIQRSSATGIAPPHLFVFGESSNWIATILPESARGNCSVAGFGGYDPSPGYSKSCYYAPLPPSGVIAAGVASTPRPSQLYVPVACAKEGGACAITQPSIVIYGAGTSAVGVYAESGSVACNQSAFSQPVASPFSPPVASQGPRACQAIPFSQFEPCATRSGLCKTNGTSLMIYGSDKSWAAMFITGDTSCEANIFGVRSGSHRNPDGCRLIPLNSATPVTTGGAPSRGVATVPGSTISPAELAQTMKWLVVETWGIANMPICWKPSYDRGVGVLPTCGDKQQRGALCYDACRDGFKDNNTATCLQTSCPSGYTDTGLICHFNGLANIAYPSHWDSGINCIVRGVCIGGLVIDHCPSNYYDNGAGCSLRTPSPMTGSPQDPMKASYTRSASPMNSCNSNRVFQAGLCYLTPRANYTCAVTSCTANCAAGTTDCGPAACASSAASCGVAVANMVLGPLQMVATIATAGTAGPALVAAKATAEGAEKAGDVLGTGDMMQSAIEQAMSAATQDLASISSSYAEDQIARKWGRGSANYKTIARAWGGMNLVLMIANTDASLAKAIVSTADPTGTAATITAYANPPCLQHSPIP